MIGYIFSSDKSDYFLTSDNTTKADFYPSFLFFDFSFSSIFFSVWFHYNNKNKQNIFKIQICFRLTLSWSDGIGQNLMC